jgi:iron complex outermembrane receptor protein
VTSEPGVRERSTSKVLAAVAAVLLFSSRGLGQAAPESGPPAPESAHEDVSVIAPTPLDGTPVDAQHFPGNIRHLSGRAIAPGSDAIDAMDRSLGGVQLSNPQGGLLEPDVFFRGFAASPLLGTPQGISVYQDGVRLNEGFGDAVHWELLPAGAISEIDVLPGSDPLFGLNSLGGAVSIHTKTGFSDPGAAATLSGGSYGARRIDLAAGDHGRTFGWFVAGEGIEEDGWRQASPARIGRLFADGSWRGTAAAMDLTAEIASSRISGNGTVPQTLLSSDRSAVFTTPDSSRTRDALLAWRGRTPLSENTTLSGNLSVRWIRPESSNGDATPYFPCSAPSDAARLCREVGDAEVRVQDQQGRDVFATGLDAAVNRASSRETASAATIQVESQSSLFGRTHRFVLGAAWEDSRARYASSTELATFDAGRAAVGSGLVSADSIVRLDAFRRDLGVFFSDALTLSRRLTLVVGGRYDRSSISLDDRLGTELDGSHVLSRFNPTAGVTAEFAPGHVAFANFSEAFRAPTPVELTCADPADPCRIPSDFVSDPALAGVVARTIETGARGTERFGSWTVSFFRTTTRHDILFVSDGIARGQGHFESVGETRRQGVEVSLSGKIARRWSWSFDFTWLDATFQSSFTENSPDHPDAVDGAIAVRAGDRLPGVPKQELKAGIEGRLLAGWIAGVDVNVLSSQFLRGDEANLLAPLSPRFGVALRTEYAFSRFSLFAAVSNVLDRRDATFGQVGNAQPILNTDDPRFVSPSAPRRVQAGVKIRL